VKQIHERRVLVCVEMMMVVVVGWQWHGGSERGGKSVVPTSHGLVCGR